ncbi:hypothetical protein [Mycetocola saprophilus]|uniref:hypothetical protein n=1 Tax=Mycetocola saprophilus TaxID=76636 RepID=UPI00068C8A9C|nr:hypothetical protein [Mycetocola saprophilus]
MVIVIALAAVVLTAFPVAQPAPASAADLSKFDPANIISDDVFYNGNTMNAAQVQSFLESKVAACAPGNVCMRNLVMDTPSRDGDSYCKAYNGASRETAAQILVKVSQACGINPQVLIVLLQKEQGLITKSAPGPLGSYAWERATGYACPDTAACDTRYFGYFNQLYSAARQFKLYGNTAWFTRYPVGKPTQIQWHPNVSCGTGTVTIKNKATAALYYYTPYQPNAAAIAAGYGVGDSCSTYGNRNFYQYFVDWFGSTQGGGTPSNPTGQLELVQGSSGLITVAGWTSDPATNDPINVHVYVNGTPTVLLADLNRPDVGRHGFSQQIPVLFDGAADVCVYGINTTTGANTLLGCQSLTLPAGAPPELGRAPFGSLDSVSTGPGQVTVSGWSIDPDSLGPVAVHVYVGNTAQPFTANLDRSDIGRIYPKYGAGHGFSATVTGVSGNQNVCVYAIDTAGKASTTLGCQTVNIPAGIPNLNRSPIGNLEAVVAGPGTVQVSGWALDPDTASSIRVHVYVDGVGAAFTADQVRNDVGALYPQYGAKHGFSVTVPATKGARNVCVYAIDTGSQPPTTLGCQTVTVLSNITEQGRKPIGNFEAATSANGKISVSGWALDPDTENPIPVHIYVGSDGRPYTADKPRPDVARGYPDYGPNHGFSESIPAAAGSYQVCAYAIDSIGKAGNTLLGCRSVTVAGAPPADNRSPIGNLEAVTAVPGGIQVSGWALDPANPSVSIPVHVYRNGTGEPTLANLNRPDVAAGYPQAGAAHGFTYSMASPPGTYQVCTYAISAGSAAPTQLGCRAVTVR